MLKWIVIGVLCIFLVLCSVSYLYGISLRAAHLISGKNSLRMAYKHYLEYGYPTNHGNRYKVYLTTNEVTIGGTNYQCFLTIEDERLSGEGVS